VLGLAGGFPPLACSGVAGDFVTMPAGWRFGSGPSLWLPRFAREMRTSLTDCLQAADAGAGVIYGRGHLSRSVGRFSHASIHFYPRSCDILFKCIHTAYMLQAANAEGAGALAGVALRQSSLPAYLQCCVLD
jgi:hypothetical protein